MAGDVISVREKVETLRPVLQLGRLHIHTVCRRLSCTEANMEMIYYLSIPFVEFLNFLQHYISHFSPTLYNKILLRTPNHMI
jgi:hypothetical protein